jgi:hypothetical protein
VARRAALLALLPTGGAKSVTYVAGLKCYVCLRSHKGKQPFFMQGVETCRLQNRTHLLFPTPCQGVEPVCGSVGHRQLSRLSGSQARLSCSGLQSSTASLLDSRTRAGERGTSNGGLARTRSSWTARRGCRQTKSWTRPRVQAAASLSASTWTLWPKRAISLSCPPEPRCGREAASIAELKFSTGRAPARYGGAIAASKW